MDLFVGVDTVFVRKNLVLNFTVEMTNFGSLFKPQIHYKFYISCVAGRFS